MSKVIIGIHGLGNKPPYHILHEWWRKSISDGLKAINHLIPLPKLDLVYWANFIYNEPLDPDEKNAEHPLFVEDPYSIKGKIIRGKSEPTQRRIRDYLEKQLDKLLLNEDLTINFSGISDFIIHHFFHDLEIYYSSGLSNEERSNYLAREAIREKLADTLRRHRDNRILLIAHSMGSIIAYDVLTQVVPDISIDTFVTCGSPLGIPVIISKIKAEQKSTAHLTRLQVPENITDRWYNLSDLRDRVAINYNLADDYDPNSVGLSIIDKQVSNTYEYNDVSNPHKSYGYLRTPEMSEIIYDFFCKGRSPISVWITEKIYRLLHPEYLPIIGRKENYAAK